MRKVQEDFNQKHAMNVEEEEPGARKESPNQEVAEEDQMVNE